LEDKDDDEAADSDAEEGLDDEELNEMLKRSDQELAVFKKLDSERNRTESDMHKTLSGGRGKKLDRLIQDDELPEIYRNQDVVADMTPLLELGRGQRSREQVRYDDNMTDDEWVEVSKQKECFASYQHDDSFIVFTRWRRCETGTTTP
jgi:ATP-dependent helicase STH1/SNF2